ncbi:MAG: hypothetical protein N3A59_02005 [Thermodesulfovibrionales bacterium]|nr:hypothetical protein [Thermodesulfovibrionales bacterium]
MSLFPQGYILGSKSDLIARAATLLREELEMQELQIMNSCNNINTSTNSRSVYLSGQGTAQTGDISFIVQTNITNIGVNIWRVNVRVIGPNNYPNITESLVVTRQLYYRHGC